MGESCLEFSKSISAGPAAIPSLTKSLLHPLSEDTPIGNTCKSILYGSVTPTSIRSLRQCRCIRNPEANDQNSIRKGKMKSVRCLGCDRQKLLPISKLRNTLGGMSDLVRVKNSNEKPKKKDSLLQSVKSISTSEANDNMASTPSSSLAYENDIFDVVSLKSEVDGFNENCRKNDYHLQSSPQSFICEGNDSILSTPSCKPSFWNEDIEILHDFVNTARSNENLRVKYCHDLRKRLERMADMVRVKNLNEKPKKKDGLLQSAQSISISEVNGSMVSTPLSSLAFENDITDVVGLKSESDRFNENFRKKDCHLQSAQHSLICEGNDLILSTRSCKPSFQNEDIERLPDSVNTERSNDILRENYCSLQYAKQISGNEGDAAHFPSLGNPTFDSHLENNQSKTDFASINELNQRLKVEVSLQCSQKVSANAIWDTEQCVKTVLLQNNGQESENMLPKVDHDCVPVQLKVEEKQVITEATVKSQIDRYDENLSEEDFCLKSPKQTDIFEGNDTVLPIGIERLPGSVTSARFKENLREKECHLPSVLQLCSSEEDDEHLSSSSGIPAFENDLDPNFASVDKLNEKVKVRDCLQALQKTSNVGDQERENFGEINIPQNKVKQSESFFLKEYHRGSSARFHSEERQNEIADMVTPSETVEGSGLRADEKDRIYEQVNELKHQVVSGHWWEAADSKGYQKYAKVANLSKGSSLKDVHDIHEERMAYCDNDRECPTDKEQKLDQSSNEIEIMDIARKQYFAALIAAKEEPGEESLALAAGLRLELESFLSIPSFSSFVSSLSRMHTLEI